MRWSWQYPEGGIEYDEVTLVPHFGWKTPLYFLLVPLGIGAAALPFLDTTPGQPPRWGWLGKHVPLAER